MSAVCWSSVQLVPAAVVGVRAFYAHRLNKDLDAEPGGEADEVVEEPAEPLPEPV